MFDQMMEMGFAESLVLSALKQTDNNMVQALNMIETEPELLVEASQTEMQTRSRQVASGVVTDQVLIFALILLLLLLLLYLLNTNAGGVLKSRR